MLGLSRRLTKAYTACGSHKAKRQPTYKSIQKSFHLLASGPQAPRLQCTKSFSRATNAAFAVYRITVDKNSEKTRPVMHCQRLRMKGMVDMKVSNSRVTLDTCTNAREAIIHFHQFNQEKEPSKVYRSKIIYVPWRNESSDLLSGYRDFCSHYEDKIDDILENERRD